MTEAKEKTGCQELEGDGEQPLQADKATLKRILHDSDVKMLVMLAKKTGDTLASKELATSQVRSFFGKVREIEAREQSRRAEEQLSDDSYRELLLLKPKLAYQAKRAKQNSGSDGVAELAKVLSLAIDLVEKDSKRFRNFVDFFEAILAYHKAAGGRES